MLAAVEAALPADVFIARRRRRRLARRNCRRRRRSRKAPAGRRRCAGRKPRHSREISQAANRHGPALVIGFAAETEDVAANARDKLRPKGCDLIVANSVAEGRATFGGATNEVQLVDATGSSRGRQ